MHGYWIGFPKVSMHNSLLVKHALTMHVFFMHDIAFKIMYNVWTINRGKVMHRVVEYKHAWILDWFSYVIHA